MSDKKKLQAYIMLIDVTLDTTKAGFVCLAEQQLTLVPPTR